MNGRKDYGERKRMMMMREMKKDELCKHKQKMKRTKRNKVFVILFQHFHQDPFFSIFRLCRFVGPHLLHDQESRRKRKRPGSRKE